MLLWSFRSMAQNEKLNFRDSVDWYNFQLTINYSKAQISDYEYHIYANTHAVDVYNRHHEQSSYIFWIVVIIVGCGLLFSGVQFFITIKSFLQRQPENVKRGPDPPIESPKEPQQETTFKVSKEGIEISSSILGVIILAMSIVFFYLYLHFVYPITIINEEPTKIESKH